MRSWVAGACVGAVAYLGRAAKRRQKPLPPTGQAEKPVRQAQERNTQRVRSYLERLVKSGDIDGFDIDFDELFAEKVPIAIMPRELKIFRNGRTLYFSYLFTDDSFSKDMENLSEALTAGK